MYSSKVKKIAEEESKLNLYQGSILGIPAWRVLRFATRTSYFKKNTEFNNKSNKKEPVGIGSILRSYFKSFVKLSQLLLSSKRQRNVIFAFPRLAKVEGTSLDKFTDPVIEYSHIKDDFLILQRGLSGRHNKPRLHQEQTIETDFIDNTAKLLGVVLFPLFFLGYLMTILNIYKKVKGLYGVGIFFVFKSSMNLGEFYVKYFFIKVILKKLHAKNVFVVSRGAFIPVIVAARKAKASVYEMQHGVTMADTILYTGEYHPLADPDYFLAFGKKWIAPQFYIPLEKIINIGWGYKRMLKNSLQKPEFSNKCILVVSSPNCTFMLFDLVVELAKKFAAYEFHIRLHPQEGYKEEHYKKIERIANIKMDDQAVDSAIVVSQYQYFVGENSSVLYEALCLNKKVARLAMGGLDIKDDGGVPQEGFYYIRNEQDFESYVKDTTPRQNKDLGIYDDFKEETINRLIE